MQKKLYFLNEEEKNRILNLHESRTKKQYLISEQTSLPKGSWTKLQKNRFDEIVSGFGTYSTRTPLINALKKFCGQEVFGPPTMTDEEIKANATSIEDAMEAGYKYTYGFASRGVTYETIPKFRKKLQELGNIVNFCYSITTIKNLRNAGETILDIFDEIQSNNARRSPVDPTLIGFIPDILEPLKTLAVKTKIVEQSSITPDTSTETTVGWTDPKFVCVKNIPTLEDAPETKYSKLNSAYYFLDGGYLAQSDYDKGKEYSGSFYCDKLGKIKYKLGEYPTGKNAVKPDASSSDTGQANVEQKPSYTPPVATGIGAATRSVSSQIPTLLQQAGIEGTSLTQDAINKLYDKLSKKA